MDCGVSNVAEIELAASWASRRIVIDHHNPPADLPPALAVVNPKLPGYPFRDLCGCAVASKVEWALRFSRSPFFGASLCLLNARPANETVVVEAVRMVNLVETGGSPRASCRDSWPSRRRGWPRSSAGDEVLVLDAPAQARLLARLRRRPGAGSVGHGPARRQFLPTWRARACSRSSQAGAEASLRSPAPEIDALADLFLDWCRARAGAARPVFGRMDLVTLGTLADLMPLLDENRIMVRVGLESLGKSERDGLRRIFQRKDLLGRRISTADIAWQVAPVLNSAGRLGEPGKATRMFLSKTAEETEALVEELFALDTRRKSLGEATWATILPLARESFEKTGGRCVLVHDEKIPRGITGIMASRLQGVFKVPAIVIARGPDAAIGSIRSNRARVIEEFFAPAPRPS